MSAQQDPGQENKKTSFNLLLGAGIAFVLIGVFLLGILSADIEIQSIGIIHLVCAALGSCILFVSVVKVRRRSALFSGCFLVMTGMLLFFIRTKHIPYTLDALWPLVVVIGGVSLLVSSCCVQAKVRASQLIPAIALILLGGCYLLFSLNIIQQSFLQLASRWWPLVLIMAGVSLVTLFFMWNKGTIQLEDSEDDFNDLDTKN